MMDWVMEVAEATNKDANAKHLAVRGWCNNYGDIPFGGRT